MPDPMFDLQMITGDLEKLELADFFANFGIGRGKEEFKRGKAILQGDMGFEDDKKYARAVRELAAWCEV